MSEWLLEGFTFVTERDEELGETVSEERRQAFMQNVWRPYTIWLEADVWFVGDSSAPPLQTLRSTSISAVPSDVSQDVLDAYVWMFFGQIREMLGTLGMHKDILDAQIDHFWLSEWDADVRDQL